MSDLERIKKSIQAFSQSDLKTNAVDFFKVLGYQSNRTRNVDLKTFLPNLNHQKALVSQWQDSFLLFQLADDNLQDSLDIFSSSEMAIDNTIMQSYIFAAIELKEAVYNRSQLVEITRAVNKDFSHPILLLFKHGTNLTLSVIHRRLNKKDSDKDVLEKVTLLKDIRIENTHRAHLDILTNLTFDNLVYEKHKPSNFVELHHAWRKVLDIKELNKKFYKEISQWYFWAVKQVTFPNPEKIETSQYHSQSLIRLLTRLLFVWFIKEKDLVPSVLFDEKYIANILKSEHESRYYRAILQNLFFATLNQTRGNREFRKDKQNMNVTNLMRYRAYFNNPDDFLNLLENVVPFMNGGLFECLDKPIQGKKGKQGGDVIAYFDGFSDRDDNVLSVPDFIFFGTHKAIDLSEELGSKSKTVEIKGLIDIFNSYKFTIAENTPIEEDIALDPELLGQVFENLLASYNPETGVTARKQTGSFYTPREIVDYMVDESLIAYFESVGANLFASSNDDNVRINSHLRQLLSYNDSGNPFDLEQTTQLIKAIDNCKILDPACGSGAFPMGILHKLVHCLHKLDPKNTQWKQRQMDKINAIDDPDFRDKTLQALEDAFDNEVDYGRKLYLIELCIYGVDIQPIAIQISKLRCFISLIVEQIVRADKDNFGILPLPNLETKFVAANTLIGVDKQMSIFHNPEIDVLENQLKEIRHRLFSAKTPKTKRELRAKDEVLREQIGKLLMASGWEQNTASQLAQWNPYDQNTCSAFFDVEWMFSLSNGFDIVIGNPPYLRVQSLKESDKKIYELQFKSAVGSYDLYVLFNEKCLGLLNEKGILNYIQPDKWINSSFGKGLRKITKNHIAKLISFKQHQVFNASTYSSLLWLKKEPQKKLFYTELDRDLPNNTDLQLWLNELTINYFNGIENNTLSDDGWDFTVGENNPVMQCLLKHKQTLGDITRKIFQGIATSADKIYVLKIIEDNGDIIHCYSKQLDREIKVEKGLTRPFLMGKDVHRYETVTAKNVVIFPYLIKQNKAVLMTQAEIQTQFPLGWNYLMENKIELELREHGKFAENWWCFSRPQNMTEFLAIKLMTPEIALGCQMTIDENGEFYHTTKIYSFVFNHNAEGNAKYFLGLLNAKVLWYFLTQTGYILRGGYYTFKTDYLKPFPIPESTIEQREVIEILVDKILAAKKQNQPTSDLEREIDEKVYQLYGLTNDEIKIIEGGK